MKKKSKRAPAATESIRILRQEARYLRSLVLLECRTIRHNTKFRTTTKKGRKAIQEWTDNLRHLWRLLDDVRMGLRKLGDE